MKTVSVFVSVISLTGAALSQSTASQYGQVHQSFFILLDAQIRKCGGTGWTGATLCPSSWTCTELNTYYSQCLPGASTVSTVSTVTTTSSGSVGSGTTTTTTTTASGGSSTLAPENSFIRAVVRAVLFETYYLCFSGGSQLSPVSPERSA